MERLIKTRYGIISVLVSTERVVQHEFEELQRITKSLKFICQFVSNMKHFHIFFACFILHTKHTILFKRKKEHIKELLHHILCSKPESLPSITDTGRLFHHT